MTIVEEFLNGFLTEPLSSIYAKGYDTCVALKDYSIEHNLTAYKAYYENILCVVNDDYSYPDNIRHINGGIYTLPGYGGISSSHKGLTGETAIFEGSTIYSLFPFARYRKYKDISPDEKYFYPIILTNSLYFAENEYGLKCVPEKILNDVRNNKAKIIILLPSEGYTGSTLKDYKHDLVILQNWIDDVDIPSSNVYYIGGNLLLERVAQNTPRIKFNAIGVSIFEIWNNLELYKNIELEFKPIDTKYLYLNMNRMPRFHRMAMILKLVASGLFGTGLNSFNLIFSTFKETAYKLCNGFDKDEEEFRHLQMLAETLDQYKRLNIDTDNTSNLAVNLNTSLFERTFISLVTETLVAENCIFLTEKIWKPIIIGHPFIVLSNNNTLSVLKEYGFKTFDKWIDESYDTAINFDVKTDIIIKNLKKFNSMSISQLKNIRDEMKEVCEHNKRVFEERVKQKFYFPEQSYGLMGGTGTGGCRPVGDILLNIKNTWV